LLDQKDEESRRARRLRRRTLLLSILIQALLLTLLLLRPLFGAQELHMTARLVPVPPWRGQPGAPAAATHRPPRAHVRPTILPPSHMIFNPVRRPAPPEDADSSLDGDPAHVGPGSEGPGNPDGLIPLGGLPGPLRPDPPPPPREVERPQRGPLIVVPEIQQARLVVRVEPQYPALAKQIRLEGTVQIRAVIGKDGTVQSVEILSGHPLLARAAQDAILRWRYTPTLLRGEPVEVETLITVIFKMQ